MSMQHIDEGVLHAWLDGAIDADAGAEGEAVARHLAECAECRARLEEARTSGAAVSAMLLASNALVPPPPSFAALESAARSKDDAPDRSTGGHSKPRASWRRGPRVRLAWAATVAVAVSAGLLARELSDRRGLDLPATLESEREALREEPPGEPSRQKSEQKNAESAELRQAPAAAPRVDADEMAGRARSEATPSPALIASVPAATGCWRSTAGTPGGIPGWFRLRENPDRDLGEGSRTVEMDSETGAMSPSSATWKPLGADSIVVSFPGLEARLRVVADRLEGTSRDTRNREAVEAAHAASELSFERVPCPSP